jgi:hypothetical protein
MRAPIEPLFRAYHRMKPLLPGVVCDMLELRLQRTSALVIAGWPNSRRAGLPVDTVGRPLPWYTYSAIRFLDQIMPLDASVFEYGMGNSTLWWSARATRVECCEHSLEWYTRLKPTLPANVTVHLHPMLSEEYVEAGANALSEIDILVIDGRRRVASARRSLARISAGGIVLWDNTDRDYYAPGCDYLAEQGFKRLDFWGMGPINVYEWCTTIFYRPNNCFGI